jgi:hypothetical protein
MANNLFKLKAPKRLGMVQPRPVNRLQTLPQELRDMIYTLVVVSPIPIPARVHLRDISTSAEDTDTDPDSNDSSSSSNSATFTTCAKISPGQPALSRVDRATRAVVLRIFYEQNTFLFRAHTYDHSPLRTWLMATSRNYTPATRLIRHVVLETTARKTCGPRPPTLPQPQPSMASKQERHLYRVLVSAKPGDEDLTVRFDADLAVMCGCALRTAGLLTPAPKPSRELLEPDDSSSSSSSSSSGLPLSLTSASSGSAVAIFASNVEYSLCLMYDCAWQFCDASKTTACRDCGLRVHRGEKLGRFLLEMAERAAQREAERLETERQRAAEQARRDAERAERQAREEARRAERMAVVEAQIAALRADGRLEAIRNALHERTQGQCVVM